MTKTNKSKGRVLILGGSSEVALALCRQMSKNNYEIVLAARNSDRLKPFQADIFLKTHQHIELIDCDIQKIKDRQQINSIAGKIDILCVFVGYLGELENPFNELEESHKIFDINFTLLTEIIAAFSITFSTRKKGMIVALSSVAGERGRASNFVYGSAKAALSVYIDGLRGYLYDKGVHVLKVIPGFMKTKMLEGKKTPQMLTATPKKSANIIYKAIEKRKNIVYIDWKWYWIMSIIKKIPESIFKKLKL